MKILYKNIIIPATSGKRTVAEASDVFKCYIDSEFKNWKLDKEDNSAGETNLAVLEIEKDGTFKDIFGEDFKKKCLTQEQIISFCESHSDKLSRDWYNFFLFKVDDEFFVADVSFYSDGLLKVSAYRFSGDGVWIAGYCHRIVVPTSSLSDISPSDPLPSDSLTLAIEEVKKAGYKIFKEI